MLKKWRADALNLTALTCLQASNAVIPLLIVPFSIARLGTVSYANVAIAEAISMIAVAIVLYSFEVDGVSRISGFQPHSHREALSKVLSAVLTTRLILFVGIATILLVVTFAFTSLPVVLLACWLLVPLGQVFHSYWFYQGIEFNIPPAILTLTARLLSLVLVLLFVHSPQDSILVPLAIGGPFAIAGIASTLYKVYALGLRLRWVRLRIVFDYLTHGHRIFVGTAAVMLYREVNVLLMGMVGVPAGAISSYSLAEKSIKMIQAITRPLNQIAFPKVLRALRGYDSPGRDTAVIILRYTLPQIAVVTIVVITLLLSFNQLAPRIDALRRFQELPGIGIIFAIVAPAPVFGLANFMFGSAGLNFLGDQRYYLRAILTAGTASAIGCLLLAHLYGAIGAAICFCGAELLLLAIVIVRYRTRPHRLADYGSPIHD
ncbi:oligosaccharide flippase family protein [Sphingomonas sp. dw_22]|uniref:oligosaccharide flippase family protein n=1 Tax=Sphingomonas sp. dw_22 TaxID=2721175 RepID=UPI001BD46B1C|nr:oligosaccharide flippase family protein [Sphingomonas sp. dw_22]